MCKDICIWEETTDGWQTSCGHLFVLLDGTPEQNRMMYCPYCSGRLRTSVLTSLGETIRVLLEFVEEVSREPYHDSDLASLLKTMRLRAQKILSDVSEIYCATIDELPSKARGATRRR